MSLPLVSVGALAACWAVTPFLRKYASASLNYQEFVLVNHFVLTLLFSALLVYYLYSGTVRLNSLGGMKGREVAYLVAGACLSVAGTLLFVYLLQRGEASSVLMWAQPASVILAVGIGYAFFMESPDPRTILGCALILGGLVTVSSAKEE